MRGLKKHRTSFGRATRSQDGVLRFTTKVTHRVDRSMIIRAVLHEMMTAYPTPDDFNSWVEALIRIDIEKIVRDTLYAGGADALQMLSDDIDREIIDEMTPAIAAKVWVLFPELNETAEGESARCAL